MNPVLDIVVCPACRGQLNDADDRLLCTRCDAAYLVRDGIPWLYPPENRLTIDPAALRLKSDAEAAQTVGGMTRIDAGFIRYPKVFYAIYTLLILAVIFKFWWVALAFVVLLFGDWLYFRWKRGRTLAGYQRGAVRLETIADYQAVDDIYAQRGQSQPNMADWVKLARRATGDSHDDESTDDDDERYLDILEVYEQSPPAQVVVDVGANDGRAYYRFGVGKGASFIGIDVSHLLLKQFLEHAPDQTALLADGIRLPLADNSVDFLFCTETLEHISRPTQAVEEFIRVLKPGGRFMVQSPNAHRIRNLNPFHIMTLGASLFSDALLQKKALHENTWHNGITYHWDFSIQDYRRMVRGRGVKILDLRTRAYFFPAFLLGGNIGGYRAKERVVSRIPFFRLFGGDLVMVAEKLT